MKLWKIIAMGYIVLIIGFFLIIFIISEIKVANEDCKYYIIQDSRPNYYIETPNITLEIDGINITLNSSNNEKVKRIRICKNETYLIGEQ